MLQFLLVTATALTTAAAPTDPWHRLIEEKARLTLQPLSVDYPQGYGQISCNPAEDIKSSGSDREAVIECWISTSCGPSGTLFLYRQSPTKAALQFSTETSGYMGGYYELADLDGDGAQEIAIVSGTDGVAPSQLSVHRRRGDSWAKVPVKEECGAYCSGHDYLFVTEPQRSMRTLLAVKGCELERGNSKPCTPGLARIELTDSGLRATELSPGSDQSFRDLLRAAVSAVLAADRKEPDRNDVTLQILGEIHDQAGLARPPQVPKHP
jgi:hypothetical protein